MPVPTVDGYRPRQFVPATDARYGYISELSGGELKRFGGLIHNNYTNHTRHLRSIYFTGPSTWDWTIEHNTLVVDTASWSRNVGSSRKFSYGVFFCLNSRYNTYGISGLASSGQEKSNMCANAVAALEGMLAALGRANTIARQHTAINDIKISLDNAWIMELLVWGRPLQHATQLYTNLQLTKNDVKSIQPYARDVEAQLDEMERRGLRVEFWLVGSRDLEEAEKLAEGALDDALSTSTQRNRPLFERGFSWQESDQPPAEEEPPTYDETLEETTDRWRRLLHV